jgi:hypothetical protein
LTYLLFVIHLLILAVELLTNLFNMTFVECSEAFCLPFSCVLVEDWHYLDHCDMGLVYYENQMLTGVYWGQTEISLLFCVLVNHLKMVAFD